VVPGDRRDPEQVDCRVGGGQQDRDGVVVPGIAVEDDLFHGRSLVVGRRSGEVGRALQCAPQGRRGTIR